MSLAHSPRIVTDGLVLALDAGNIKSYSGSGTTWNDIIGGNNATIIDSFSVYQSNDGGRIVFDGSTDYVTIPLYILILEILPLKKLFPGPLSLSSPILKPLVPASVILVLIVVLIVLLVVYGIILSLLELVMILKCILMER